MTSEFNKVIAYFEFIIDEYDKCIHSKKLDNDYIILCLHVDDILIFGTSLDAIQRVKISLSQNFDMKNLSPADMILEWNYLELLMKFHWICLIALRKCFINLICIALNLFLHLWFFNCFEEEYGWACVSTEILSIIGSLLYIFTGLGLTSLMQ